MPSDCPYNMFTSAPNDIRPNFANILQHLNTTVAWLGDDSLSRPGAWANPDMLGASKTRVQICYVFLVCGVLHTIEAPYGSNS